VRTTEFALLLIPHCLCCRRLKRGGRASRAWYINQEDWLRGAYALSGSDAANFFAEEVCSAVHLCQQGSARYTGCHEATICPSRSGGCMHAGHMIPLFEQPVLQRSWFPWPKPDPTCERALQEAAQEEKQVFSVPADDSQPLCALSGAPPVVSQTSLDTASHIICAANGVEP